MIRKKPLSIAIALALLAPYAYAQEITDDSQATLEELDVVGESKPAVTTHFTSPSMSISDIEAESINASSIEDFVKYEPSMVVRRRYIGDSNGVVGIRGSNMFQTARAMVYADDLPLHSLLETRWNGAPRWGLVAADETEMVEVIYGPFSAEYSGNAMGGVIDIKTKLPTERSFHFEGGIFAQDYQHLGADHTYTGYREFASYGDRVGDTSIYLFHNHLENDGQPMTFRSRSISGGGGTVVTGAYLDKDTTGTDVIYVGDSGPANSVSDLTKIKIGSSLGAWDALFTLGYEDRDWITRPTNYLVDVNGNPVWSGNATFNGNNFSISSGNYAVSDQNRQNVLIGVGLEGPLGDSGWILETDFSYYDVLNDQTLSSKVNPSDPTYADAVDGAPDGTVKEFDDTGWVTVDLKGRSDRFLNQDNMNMVFGYHFDDTSLNIHQWNSENYLEGNKTSRKTSTGGNTLTHAVFAQWGWGFASAWDIALGARYEYWKTYDSYYYKYGGDMEDYTDRSETGFSPKFSLGLNPDNPFQLRYSLAQAYRFPIVEELYANEEKINGTTIADASLKPEVGLHHNLMAQYDTQGGFIRANLYYEVVDDVIWSQEDIASGVSTFLPVTEVTTSGVEFIIQQNSLFGSDLDLRFNVAYTDSEITKNSADPTTVGKVFPRMPEWRSSMLATWHITSNLDSSLGVRYASNSYGNLDNSDTQEEVYGAQDEYLFVDLKANYQMNEAVKISFGVDNVNNDVAFVAHPWPQRTYYLQGSFAF